MLVVVFGALVGAGVAHLGADATHIFHEPRTTTHVSDAQTTNFRAIETVARAIRHTAQTLVGAVIAFLGTATTGDDARLMLFVRHDDLLKNRANRRPRQLCNRNAIKLLRISFSFGFFLALRHLNCINFVFHSAPNLLERFSAARKENP